MRHLVTTLAATFLLVTACDRGGGSYPEEYLSGVWLDLYLNSPAQVSGYLAPGVTLEQALEHMVTARIRYLTIRCSYQDSIAIEPILASVIVPVEVSTENFTGSTAVTYSQDGITWTPGYSWTRNGSPRRFDATIKLSNVSGRSWTVTGVTMMDDQGMPVCGIPDSVSIPDGELITGWWSAEGYALTSTLVFGWPSYASWNHLAPFVTEGIGPLQGPLGGLPEWPLRTGDTLWIPSEEDVVLTENLTQHPRGYNGTLDIDNRSGDPVSLRLSYPDLLPRGAEFKVEGDPSRLLMLEAGEKVRLEYTIAYP